MFIVRLSSSSMSKHSGALMSSRLMPPKVGSSNWQARMTSFGIFGGQLDVEDIDIGEAFEQDALAFHDRLAGGGPILPKPSTAVPLVTTRDQVALRGVLVDRGRILLDFEARNGHARRVGQAQVALRPAGLGRGDGNLAGGLRGMVLQRLFFTNQHN